MADKFLNLTAVQTIKTWADGKYALDADLDALEDKVDDIIAEGGEPNVIEVVKVNGTALTPDSNKAVDVTVPIETIKVNNIAQTPDANKAVNVRTTQIGGAITPSIYVDVIDNDSGNSLTFVNETDYVGISAILEGDDSFDEQLAKKSYVDTHGGKIDSISIDGTTQTIDTNKNVALDLSDYAKDADIPTATSDLTNDSDFQTGTEVQTAIDNALADITGIDFEVVQSLPATGEKGVIYLLANSGSGSNTYDEYIWLDGDPTGRFEKIGTTDVDLSNYWTSTTGQSNTLEAATVAEINAILNA